MNYTYQENIETSAYTITLTFDEDISKYFTTDDFEIGIRDQYTNYVTTINKDNWQNFGITDDDPTISNRPKNSLYKNGGILLYPDNNKLYLKQIVKCTDTNGANIGFNSSEVNIWFTPTERVKFNTFLFPKLKRSEKMIQVDEVAEDPLLPEPNMRQEFNYDKKPFAVENLNGITTNYNAGNEDAIYVNTDISVPCYYSEVSAIMRTTNDVAISPCNVSSYLYDDDAQTFIDIPYDPAGPFTAALDLPDGLVADAEYFTYKQYLRSDGDDLYKNRLVLGICTEGIEIVDPLNRLIINVDPTPADKKINRTTQGSMVVTITNPNPGYIVRPTVFVNDTEIDYSIATYDETTGTLTFTMSDITDGDLLIKTWLDHEGDEIRSPALIKTQTINELMTHWTYEKLPLDRFTVTNVKYYKTSDGENYTEVTGPTIPLDKGEIGKVTATITNPNTDYLDNLLYPVEMGVVEHPELEKCTFETKSYNPATGEYEVEITNIKVSDAENNKTHVIQIFASMNSATEDFTNAEVIEYTYASSNPSNWIYTHVVENLTKFTITNVRYYIDDTELSDIGDTIELLAGQVGKITADITNTNNDYITDDRITVELIIPHSEPSEQCILTRGTYDPATGVLPITISNIKVTENAKIHSAQVQTYMSGVSEDFDEEQVKALTETSSAFAIWTYEQLETLAPLTISNIEYFVNDEKVTDNDDPIKLHLNDIGKITATITNPNSNYIDFTIHADLIQHPEPEGCSLNIIDSSVPGTIKIEITNITVTPTSNAHSAQIETYLHNATEHLTDDEVKELTDTTSTFRSWVYEELIVLDHLEITFTNYSPSDKDVNNIHWLEYDKSTGLLPTGSVKVTVHNPNENYRDLSKYPIDLVTNYNSGTISSNVYEIYNLIPPVTPVSNQNIIISNFDTSKYATTGDITFTVSNIIVARNPEIEQTRIISVSACINCAISHLTVADVTAATVAVDYSDTWKYKISTPDIGPDDEYRKYSLYSLGDLEINGGSIGSRDIACMNLTVNNGGIVNSNIKLASGCKFISNGNNTFNGSITAEEIIINNPATFNKPLYVSNSITINNITLDTVYVAEGCRVELLNGAKITNQLVWENPSFAVIEPIDGDTYKTNSTKLRGNGNILGAEGVQGTTEYIYDSFNFDNSTGYAIGTQNIEDNQKHLYADIYPGKYYFSEITTVVGTTLRLHNHESSDGDDGSIAFYIKDSASFSNNTLFDAAATGIYDFRLYYGGTGTVHIGVQATNQAGTIKAPDGTVELANNAKWKGNVWAKKIVMQQGAILVNDF